MSEIKFDHALGALITVNVWVYISKRDLLIPIMLTLTALHERAEEYPDRVYFVHNGLMPS